MKTLKIAVNIFYPPVQGLKDILSANSDILVPFNGGCGLRDDDWVASNCMMDDSGDNISSDNILLNEMTVIYWLWKNYDKIGNPEYIGFNHYRRFFNRDDLDSFWMHDIIIANPVFPAPINLYEQYSIYHCKADMDICIEEIANISNDVGERFASYIMTTCVNYAPCNMFVMKKDLFFEWCSFIFPIIERLKKRVDVSGRDNYQKRAICFLVERIFGFWCRMKEGSGMNIKTVFIDEHLDFKPPRVNERGDFS